MSPTAPSVTETFWVGMTFVIVASLYFYLTNPQEDGGPARWERWRAALVMWSERRAARRAAGMQVVSIPVSQYGMDAAGMDAGAASAADIDAENTDMPRLSRKLGDGELIVLLAAQRGKDGRPCFSANAIFTLVGGDRNTVMAKIKAVRATPPPAEFLQPDGSKSPASYPVTGRGA